LERHKESRLVSFGKIWGIIRRVILILLGLVAVFFLIFVPWFLSRLVTRSQFHYPDPNDGKSPISYGLEFQQVQFQSLDGIPLKGWYIPAKPARGAKGTIIYCHGDNRTRIEMLPEASFAHGLGYNGLVFDLRHQGQSGGELRTLGYQERLDALGAVRFALTDEKASRPVILWGISMGAAAALMAAAESPDVDAVISDSSFLSLSDVVAHHAKLFLRLPKFPLADELTYAIAWRGHFRPSDFDLEKAIERINPRPILFVAVAGDRRMPPAIAQRLCARSTSLGKSLVILPGNRHGEGFRLSRDPYEQAVKEFLAHLSPS